MQELTLLNTKLDKLLKKYAAIRAEKDSLLETVHKQKTDLQLLSTRLADLENQADISKTAGAIAGKDDKTAVRKQLNSLIGDIDKLLASLND